jgi:hypothetical protein
MVSSIYTAASRQRQFPSPCVIWCWDWRLPGLEVLKRRMSRAGNRCSSLQADIFSTTLRFSSDSLANRKNIYLTYQTQNQVQVILTNSTSLSKNNLYFIFWGVRRSQHSSHSTQMIFSLSFFLLRNYTYSPLPIKNFIFLHLNDMSI